MSTELPSLPGPAARLIGRHTLDAAALGRLADDGVLTALVDACDAPGVPERVLALGPGAGACLYQGAEALAFRDRAPYLVRVDRGVLAWIAGALADAPWGMFAVSDAPFVAQVRHWRRWLTVTSPGGEAWTFRFYDPRLAPVFLAGCTADEVAQFFGPVRSLIVPGPADAAGGPAGEMLAPAALAAGRPATRRAVGERFQLRTAHLAAFRRRNFGDALIAGVNREGGLTAQRARRDPAEPAAGDVLVASPNGAPPTRFAFGPDGFVGAVTSPLGRTWRIASDERGRPVTFATPAGAVVAMDRDAGGNVAHVRRGGGSGRARADASSARTLFRAAHDRWGRVTELAYPDGTRAAVAYHHPGDAGVVDMAGARPSVVTDRLGRTTRYVYDEDGDLTALTDALGRTTHFAYGDWRRPDAVTYPGGRVERYAYDGGGGLAAITYADGVVLRVVSDASRQTTAIESDGQPGQPGPSAVAPVQPVHVAFERDDAGRVLSARTGTADAPATTVTVAYDGVGRVVGETATLHDSEHGQPADPSATTYVYDAQGALVGLTSPTGETLGYGWDADGRLAAFADWSGRRYALDYAPDDRGWRLTTPTGVAHTVVQDALGRPTIMVVHAPDAATGAAAAQPVARTVLAYDAADQVASVDDNRLGRWRFAYDAEGQLVACDGPAAAETGRYGYDAAGNRVSVTEGAADAPAVVVDAGDRLLRQGAERLTYDACGRVVCRDESDAVGVPGPGAWAYAYDARGQLVRAEGPATDGPGRRVLAFVYDAFGRRVEKVCVVHRHPAAGGGVGFGAERAARAVTATRTRFMWAGEQCVREVVERAAWDAPDARAAEVVPLGTAWRAVEARDYAYWPGTPTPLLLRVTRPGAGGSAESATYLYHCDHVGAPVRLTDDAGRVVWEAAYAPFGGVRLTVAEVAQPWRRPGQYADDETGLSYNRFRYYAPALGRYLTPDPVGLAGGLHAYRYAENNPVSVADPLGLWSWGQVGKIALVAAASIVVGVAVGAAVVALAPAVLAAGAVTGAAVLLGGAAAGATAGVLNEGLENGFGCPACLATAGLKGAAVGALAALPFVFLPATAGVMAFAGVGGLSGAVGYGGDWVAHGMHADQWSWAGLGVATGLGALTAGAGRYVAPRVAGWWKGRGVAKPAYEFDMVNDPGPIGQFDPAKRFDPPAAANFAGGKYNARVLTHDEVLYRAGRAGGGRNGLGQYFSHEPPASAVQQRIDAAVKPQWIDARTGALQGTSPLESVYAVRVPAGTTVYEGPVASQGGVYVGGRDVIQVHIPEPWKIPGVQVISETPLVH